MQLWWNNDGESVTKNLVNTFLFCAYIFVLSNQAFSNECNFNIYGKESSKLEYQRKLTVGKVTFLFSDESACKIDEDLQKRVIDTIKAVDVLFPTELVPSSVLVKEWCGAGLIERSTLILGQGRDLTFVPNDVIAHEYAHSIFGRILGKYQEDYESHLKGDLKGMTCEVVERRMNFIESVSEFFADVVALTLSENQIFKSIIADRNYGKFLKRADLKDWEDSLSTMFDSHYALEPIWHETFEHIKRTRNNPVLKRQFIYSFGQILSNDISANMQIYSTQPFDLKVLNQRLRIKLQSLRSIIR